MALFFVKIMEFATGLPRSVAANFRGKFSIFSSVYHPFLNCLE